MINLRLLLVCLLLFLSGCEALVTPTAPTAAELPATPGRETISVRGAGAVVGGYLYRPETTLSRPAVAVLHGWLPTGTNGADTIDARARRLADDGYVALAVAMRGWAPSGGADDCGLRQPDDIVSVVAWLRTQPGVVADRIGLVGFSQGGQVALLTAARDAGIRAVVAYYPVTDVARWKTTTTNPDIPNYVSAVCEPGGVDARSPLLHPGDVAAPVLLVHGDMDTRVPTEQSTLLLQARTSAGQATELFLVPGAQHGFAAAEEALARPVVDRFLAVQLQR